MHRKYNIEKGQMTELSPDALPLLKNSALYGDDLRPVKISGRNWTYIDFATLWISMSICIPTYSLASGLITSGMNWWQAIFTIFAGNIIVLIPMVLIGAASTRYGIPYPVFCRASFGTKGAHFPALLRAGIACGWFGINCWIGGEFLYSALFVSFPIISAVPHAKFISFLFFWAVNVYLAYKGNEMIRRMNMIATPILTAAGFVVIFWALYEAGSIAGLFSATPKITAGGVKNASFASLFLPSLNAMIAYWATLALNIGDFTRLAKSQKDQLIGQSIGLPPTMAFYSLVGVMGTLGSVVVFGRG
ncbi:MAG TPA: cytosine permease, partial [Candidatus Wallbacteria bacterium]|nr:cytosine permease [Candidatus Wallbacteria bacterium]